MSVRKTEASFDIVVIGGGLSGMCAAISAARNGARVALVQNRSMFGGNASSEIRMHIVGANCHSSKPNMRETGIIEEILLENKARNPYAVFSIFDAIMWEKVHLQEGLTSYLNTNMDDVIMENGKVLAIICHQNSTESEITIYGKIFVDATGHGTLSVMAGAASRIGSESRYEFNEPTAPEEANTDTMGNSLMFVATDRGEPVKFIKPEWAYSFSENDLRYRPHKNEVGSHSNGSMRRGVKSKGEDELPEFSCVDAGYWWIELGGQYDDIIGEGEAVRDELMRCVWGVWDHLKNVGDHGIENYDLEWVGMIPGYRESRRIVGDYILTENDIRENRIFDDAVAYGGWPMDMHVRGGCLDFDKEPSKVFNFKGNYTIPYRCYCCRDVDNIMLAGRDISCTKMAMGSTRVMGTCAIGGEAVGTAAAMAVKYGCTPREIGTKHIKQLQQQLLKQGCYIPGLKNEDSADLSFQAHVFADSEIEGAEAVNIINGVSRTVGDCSNYWQSEPIGENGRTITLKFDKPVEMREIRVTFDTDLSHEIMPSIVKVVRERQIKSLPYELVKDYSVSVSLNGKVINKKDVFDNRQRLSITTFEPTVCDEIAVNVKSTYGFDSARIYEIRVY